MCSLEDSVFNSSACLYDEVKSYRSKFAKNIICAHLNVNSIRNKFDEIKYILNNGYVDILALSETKLDSSDNANLFAVKKLFPNQGR